MTKTQARKWLKPVRGLRLYYEAEKPERMMHCPLCPTVPSPFCAECLWYLFEHIGCGAWYRNNIGPYASPGTARKLHDPDLCRLRIPMLKRWERKLLKIIEEEA